MGADGGICWLTLKVPKNYDRVMKLIAPFNLIVYNDKCHYAEHMAWRDSHPNIGRPNEIVGIYGSFVDDGLNYLYSIINYDDDWEQLDYTFTELLIELETRPSWLQDSFARTAIERMLWERVKDCAPIEDAISRLDILADMTVRDWLEELRTSLYPYFNSVETWT